MESSWNFNICTINRKIYKDSIKFRAIARYESVAVMDQNGPPDQGNADQTNFLCSLSYSRYPRACFHVAYHHISHLEISDELVNLLADTDSRVAVVHFTFVK